MRKMKDSGIRWVEDVPEEWKIVRNKNAFHCAKKLVGTMSDSTQLLSLTTRGIKKKDINNPEGKLPETFDTYQLVNPENIVMCLFDMDCSAVFSGISPYSGMISPAYKVLECKKCIEPRYADYWFRYICDERKYKQYAKNIRYTVSYDEFASLPLVLPPKTVQRNIADFLDTKCMQIDAVIEKQEAIIAKLKAYRLSLITETVTKGLNPNMPMKDSEKKWVGRIPDHWNVGHLKFFATIRSGLTLGKKYSADDTLVEVPYLRVANVQGDHVDLSDVATVKVLLTESEKYRLQSDELLMTEGGDRDKLGRGCVWHGEISPCLHQNHVFAVTTDATKLNVYYLDYITTSDIGRSYFDYTAKKTTNLASTNSTTILEFALPIPPIDEQREIVNYLNDKCKYIDQVLEKQQSLICRLTEYKKSLIYEVVTGKKEVAVITTIPLTTPAQESSDQEDYEHAVLMGKILDQLGKDAKGQAHVIKCMHAITCIAGVLANTQYVRQKYGTYDERIGVYENVLQENKWFSVTHNGKTHYSKGAQFADCRAEYDRLFSENDREVRRIVRFLKPMKTSEAGRVATLLGSWNDFILDGTKNPTDAQIIEDVRTNWTPNKAKITEETWQQTLNKMRNAKIIPQGYGKHTASKTAREV